MRQNLGNLSSGIVCQESLRVFVFIAAQLEMSICNRIHGSGTEAVLTLSDVKLNRSEIQFISIKSR